MGVVRRAFRSTLPALRRARRTLYVTVRLCRPYALTVAGLACLVVAAFTLACALGWATAGAAALIFNWGLHKE